MAMKIDIANNHEIAGGIGKEPIAIVIMTNRNCTAMNNQIKPHTVVILTILINNKSRLYVYYISFLLILFVLLFFPFLNRTDTITIFDIYMNIKLQKMT